VYNPALGVLSLPTKQVILGQWKTLKLHQGWGQHDLAEVEVSHPRGQETAFTTGTPITFTFGMPGSQQRWTGYVQTPDRYVTGEVTETVLSCLGPTYSLSGSDQRSWNRISASAVVEQLCGFQSLACHTTGTPRVYDHITQAGLTDWELINRLAAENGRFVIADGVGVRFLSRPAILATFNVTTSPVFIATHTRTTQVYSWQPTASDDPGIPSERAAVKSFAGVDSRDAHVVRHVQSSADVPFGSVTGGKLFLDTKARTPVSNAAEAEALHQAASDLASWKYRLHMVTIGRANIEPGLVVRTVGMDGFSGTWVVENVTHVIGGGLYTCEIDLVTDALGELPRQYTNPGGITRALPKAAPVLRQAATTTAFATSQTRWQAQNRVSVQAFLPRPVPAALSVRRPGRHA